MLRKHRRLSVRVNRSGQSDEPILRPEFADDLLMRLDFRDPEPAVVDLSPDKGVVSTLQESKVECTIQDKVLLRLLQP